MNSDFKIPISKTFQGKNKGVTLLIFGTIHGDEICGEASINSIIQEIENGSIFLQKGTVSFVSVSNPKAHQKRVRFIEENLNRVFKKWDNPKSYEQRLANHLTGLVDNHDVLLDIHSMSAHGEPTVFIDFPTKKNIELAGVLGPTQALIGWPSLYEREGQGIVSFDTTAYANSVGKTGVLIECGQHDDPESISIARKAIINTLKHFDMIDGVPQKLSMKNIFMEHLYLKNHPKDSFKKDWNHLDSIKKGEILAFRHSGEAVISPFNGVMILPKTNAPVNTEWFYLGEIK